MPVNTIEQEPTQLAIAKKQVGGAIQAASDLKIASADDMKKATELLSNIKTVAKYVKAEKESATKPINETLRKIRSWWAPIETACEQVEATVKDKMLAYNREVEAKARVEEERIAKDLAEGKIKKTETAVKKMEAIERTEKQTETNAGKVNFVIVKKVVVEDETIVPREYLVLDMVKINRDAKSGIQIPGIKVIEEKEVRATTYY